mmetsp:Transcript_45053/g.105713  ORF Transcript_45053/g.105713 Transcript_45053/m.105713 type:complete len:293 (+) Transcript_45053:880-1758(+)
MVLHHHVPSLVPQDCALLHDRLRVVVHQQPRPLLPLRARLDQALARTQHRLLARAQPCSPVVLHRAALDLCPALALQQDAVPHVANDDVVLQQRRRVLLDAQPHEPVLQQLVRDEDRCRVPCHHRPAPLIRHHLVPDEERASVIHDTDPRAHAARQLVLDVQPLGVPVHHNPSAVPIQDLISFDVRVAVVTDLQGRLVVIPDDVVFENALRAPLDPEPSLRAIRDSVSLKQSCAGSPTDDSAFDSVRDRVVKELSGTLVVDRDRKAHVVLDLVAFERGVRVSLAQNRNLLAP